MTRLFAWLLIILLTPVGMLAQVGAIESSLTGPAPQTYYISPTGSDSNAGTNASPWLSPAGHTLNCGDVIIAQTGTYNYANFGSGHWSTVNCPSGNSVAWLKCATFDGCKINAGSNFGIWVDQSYWGVQGFEVTTSASGWTCFAAAPASTSGPSIHHIVFANDIANGCGGGGFSGFNQGSYSVDYVAIVGSIAYNAAQNPKNCYSGISIYQPVASDTLAGTHFYIASNIVYGNMNPSTGCVANTGSPGTYYPPTDGDGIILDTFDGSQGLGGTWGTPLFYTQQAVVANNILVGNGGRGMEYQTYTKGAGTHPTVYVYGNTIYGNSLDHNQQTTLLSELEVNVGYGLTMTNNIVQSTQTTGYNSNAIYGLYVYDGSTTDSISGNWIYAAEASWASTSSYNDDSQTAPTLTSNATGTVPGFSAPTVPSSGPSCSGKASVPDCMATLITGFTPTASGTAGLGFKAATYLQGTDPYFPSWLCSANLPLGIVTVKC